VDWGIAIENVAKPLGLGFIPVADEEYDFVIPKSRLELPTVQGFLHLLRQPEVRAGLRRIGMNVGAP